MLFYEPDDSIADFRRLREILRRPKAFAALEISKPAEKRRTKVCVLLNRIVAAKSKAAVRLQRLLQAPVEHFLNLFAHSLFLLAGCSTPSKSEKHHDIHVVVIGI